MMKKGIRLLALALVLSMICATAAQAAYATLRYGSQGTAVLKLQQALVKLGYTGGGTDGKFGRGTENAVRSFQKKHGLTADGLAGDRTQTLIYQLAAGNTATPKPGSTDKSKVFNGDYATISYAMTGNRVKVLQQALIDLGYLADKADGKFGGGTMNAVKAFQKANGLTADGKAGSKTLQKIESRLAKKYASAATPTPKPTATPKPQPTAQPTGYTIPKVSLRSGASGEDVKNVQRRLKELGWYTGSIDGKYGSGTIAAVKSFQQAAGLTADGVAGTGTYKKLFASNAPAKGGKATATPKPTTAPSNYTTLKKNNEGAAVERLQARLALLGYVTGTMSIYDNATVAAVRDFQTANGLKADGIAGEQTQQLLFSDQAKAGKYGKSSKGAMTGPSKSSVKLIHWADDAKGKLASHATLLIYDPVTGLGWNLRILSKGRHCDVEPVTAQDTSIQFRAFGNREDWGPKIVYVKLTDGRWTMAVLSNVAHGTNSIKDNNFNGQNCLHLLRDMSEAAANDPVWGVKCQEALRAGWKKLTGQDVK